MAVAQPLEVGGMLQLEERQVEEVGHPLQIQGGGSGEEALEGVGIDLTGLRQEVEDPAAAVVDDDDPDRRVHRRPGSRGRRGRERARGRRGRPRSRRWSRAPLRRRSRSSRRSRWRPGWRRSGPRLRRRVGTPRCRGSACSMPRRRSRRRPSAAVRARWIDGLAVVMGAEHAVDRSLGRPFRRDPPASPLAVADRDTVGQPPRHGGRVGADEGTRPPGRLVPLPGRVDDDLIGAASLDPRSQGLAGRHIAEAQDEVGCQILRLDPGDQVIAGDHALPVMRAEPEP